MPLPELFPIGSQHPNPEALAAVIAEVETLSEQTRLVGPWASGCFTALAQRGVLAGFIPIDGGGTAANESAIVEFLISLGTACLTTALALTQWASGCRIIAEADDTERRRHLPGLASGATSTTVGISQLTTSRRHLGRPAILAREDRDGWRLEGLCPWVTGGDSVDTIVTGGVTAGDEPLFFIIETAAAGVTIDPPMQLLALSGSRTSAVHFNNAPALAVIRPTAARRPGAGGLTTSALAVGVARRCVAMLRAEAGRRAEIADATASLTEETEILAKRILQAIRAGIDPADRDQLRGEANSLVLRASQAALVASKGAGFVVGHPAELAVREAMFFLVWSCPQAVAAATLCELAALT
jgi:alkylation response protein AidB-like acyl-CoA dehydrogenase